MDIENRSDIYKSRTQVKKASEALQKLGERLIKLSAGQLKNIDIPDELRKAILDSREISSNKASCRNRQFIGALMRQCDSDPIIEALDRLEAGLSISSSPKRVENPWVKAIMENDDAIESFLQEYPTGDRQQIRQLRRNALKKKSGQPTGKELNSLTTCIEKIMGGK